MSQFKLFSVDDHIIEPANVWADRVSARYRELAPHVVDCMIEEPVGLKYRHDIGVDRILWESDYPHADTPWPRSQEGASTVFAGVPRDEIDQITHGNASALFRWPVA